MNAYHGESKNDHVIFMMCVFGALFVLTSIVMGVNFCIDTINGVETTPVKNIFGVLIASGFFFIPAFILKKQDPQSTKYISEIEYDIQ